jgi:uncharacterized protein YndB with AHSA1/START domain
VTEGVAVGEPVAPIDLVLDTGADPELVWRTLVEPERVVLWLTDATTPRRVGDAYRLDFGDGSVVRGEVVVLEPGRAFGHTWAWDGAEEGEVTRVAWTIDARLGGSRVRLVHEGWAEAGMDAGVRDDHARYWSGYLDDLRDILEEA